ncbi:glycosyltransferase family 2 protein, partial [Vibrio campbellii]|uniref:glycosyltransferase family 2 protein n=1 Tax=Vibrio campbellii TaxID=680 RepID=UPI00067FD30E
KYIEVIVVDDNSDYFPINELIEKFPYVNYHVNDRGKGAGGSRNKGISVSRGQWLIFSDADDFFHSGAFETILLDIDIAPTSVDIIFYKPTSSYIYSGLPATRHLKYSGLVQEYIQDNSIENKVKLLYSHYVPWSKIIRKSLVELHDINFDETLIANDGMFSAKCSLNSRGIQCKKHEVYEVTVSNDSLTKIHNVDLFRIRLEVFTRMYSLLPYETKKIIGMSPLSLIYMSRKYGIKEFIKTIVYFKRNGVDL